MKKGIAVETIVFGIILIFALAIIMLLIMKLVPSFEELLTGVFSKMKDTFCKMIPWYTRWIFC